MGHVFAGIKFGMADNAPFLVDCAMITTVLLRVILLVGTTKFSLRELSLAVAVVHDAVQGGIAGTVGLLAVAAARSAPLRHFPQRVESRGDLGPQSALDEYFGYRVNI